MNGSFVYKQSNENDINDTNLSQGKWPCFATVARGRNYTSYKMAKKKESIFSKLNHYVWVTIGGNRSFFITTLGMRVGPSLLVFNLFTNPGHRRVETASLYKGKKIFFDFARTL